MLPDDIVEHWHVRPANVVTQSEFEWQMQTLVAQYQVLDGVALKRFILGGEPPHAAAAVVTFDDGHLDNYVHALPVLLRCGVPAIFFVTTDFIDHPSEGFWLYRVDQVLGGLSAASFAAWATPRGYEVESAAFRQSLKYSPPATRRRAIHDLLATAPQTHISHWSGGGVPMTWDNLREMARVGMSIGAHTVTHQVVSVAEEDSEPEIRLSGARVRHELGECWAFSYPNGELEDFSAQDVARVADAGYACAFTQLPGLLTVSSPRFALPRVPIPGSPSRAAFIARVSGVHQWSEYISGRAFKNRRSPQIQAAVRLSRETTT